jgi:uncharacterized protein YebE (UPF0316 family)
MMFAVFSDPNAWLMAGFIFSVRILSNTLDTMRMLAVVRGRKTISFFLGIAVTLLYVTAIGNVLKDLTNILNLAAYSIGFAVGNVVGMTLEERLAIGFTQITVISTSLGAAVAEQLREHGSAVTEIPARGRDGCVSVLEISVARKQVAAVEKVILKADPQAFITTRDVRPLRHGYFGNFL